MPIKQIKISDISVGKRLRKTNKDWVENLVKSIEKNGLLNPISVVSFDGVYYLGAGSHRLEACKLLNHTHIECNVSEASADSLQNVLRMVEVTENLLRNDLSPLHKSASLAEMKRVYEDLYPETKKGGDPNKKRQSDILSFSRSAAEKTGLSTKSIERAVAIFNGLSDASYRALDGSGIAEKQTELIAISKLDHEKQKDVIKLLKDKKSDINSVKSAIDEIDGKSPEKNPDNEAFTSLVSKWARSSEKAQKMFVTYLKEQGAIS